uniref:Integrin alpha-PS2 n=1 Tax=Bactrocera latifrons TaxID=174628 RepID=A0A0K8U9U6_BACLA
MQLSTTKRQRERHLPPNNTKNNATTSNSSAHACSYSSNNNSSVSSITKLYSSRVPLLLLLVLLLACSSHGYNIDLPSYVTHVREPNTMFGFSIALHKGASGYAQSNSLIVGAPKFDTSSYQQGVVEAGGGF